MSILAPGIPESIDSLFAGMVDASKSGWFLNDTDEYYRGFPVSPDDIVLDLGCGEEPATLFCAKRGAKVIFCDIVQSLVDKLTKKLEVLEGVGEIQPLVCDSDPLPLADASASRIVCTEVLEHVDDPARVMAELVRVGKPGSLYLLSVPGARAEHIMKHFAPKEYFEEPHHIRIFSKEDFVDLVERSGLHIESYSQDGFFWVMWLAIHWAVEGAAQPPVEGNCALRPIKPPFDDSLDRWASLWTKLISTPEGLAFKHEMDGLLPKNQVIVARKAS